MPQQFKLVDLQQRTFEAYGHFLNHRQAQSHDGTSLVYDTRNADPDIPKTRRIEAIDLTDNSVRVLYDTHSDQPYGPGVGAVVADPCNPRVLFIHGLKNCCAENPYTMGRRFGAICSLNDQHSSNASISPLESRSMTASVPWGCLRGGSHAHSFSPDGRWVSFTYNDAWVAQHHPSWDRRTIGFALLPPTHNVCDNSQSSGMLPTASSTSKDNRATAENFRGLGWASLALNPTEPMTPSQSTAEHPLANDDRSESASCEWAREECWVPNPLRLAFIGRISPPAMPINMKMPTNIAIPTNIEEVFIAEFPEDALRYPQRLQGYVPTDPVTGRLQPPPGIRIRRLTYSDSDLTSRERTNALGFCHELAPKDYSKRGIQGPRHWLLASPCGAWIFGLFRDTTECVRLVRICSRTGALRPISKPGFSITHPPAIDPSGRFASLLANQTLHLLDLTTETQMPVEGWFEQTSRTQKGYAKTNWEEVLGPVQFLKDGTGLFWNARPSGSSWLQIWTARVQ